MRLGPGVHSLPVLLQRSLQALPTWLMEVAPLYCRIADNTMFDYIYRNVVYFTCIYINNKTYG